ncbi:hypothetical protein [Rhizobium sp. L1K21]|uniref:tetratricopeptide repeat protein n=1 Tax=Rhizobium sp. L1K21 TaxID=2954933 RepID=UPI002093CCCF|nr:hypothetical protein [Rhizobium sp. L1K21]MCO6187925.1 hypothetical protein [Rhizobium sp. L1K21]
MFFTAPTSFKVFTILSGCILVFVGVSIASDESRAACDRLAASPNDPLFGSKGVEQLDIKGAAALDACRKAYEGAPDEPRFAFQLARAEQRLEDYDAARVHFSEAAKNGYPLAEVGLGILFERGLGVGQNLEEARRHYELAAEQGVGVGLFNLAGFYLDGVGVPENPVRAAELYRQAIDAGYEKAAGGLAEALQHAWREGDDPAPVVEAYVKAADAGIGFAHRILGHFYRDGAFGLPVDPAAATAHYRIGWELSDDWSGLYFAQILVSKNDQKTEAVRILRSLIESEPGMLKARAMALLSDIMRRRGDLQEAAALVEDALEIAPKDSAVLSSQAELLVLAFQLEEADQLLAEAIEQDPEWAPLHLQRASLQTKLGDKDAAAASLDRAAKAEAGRLFLGTYR